MTHFTKAILLLLYVTTTSFAADLKHEAWHKPVREYEQGDSVLVPVIDYALIQKIEVGMTFDEVKHIAGFAPVDYYIHPDYAILATKVGDEYYEVAFLHKKSRTVEAISYRKSPWKKECDFNFVVRQNMVQISNSLQGRRHFCFDANPYAIGRWGLRRNRNVWSADSSDLSHLQLESTETNKSLQATRDGALSSGWLPKPATTWMPQMGSSLRESWSRLTLVGPASLSSGR